MFLNIMKYIKLVIEFKACYSYAIGCDFLSNISIAVWAVFLKDKQTNKRGESTQHSEHLISVNSRKNNPTLLSQKASRPTGCGAH